MIGFFLRQSGSRYIGVRVIIRVQVLVSVHHAAHQDCVMAKPYPNTGCVIAGTCLTVINGDCWSLAEVCALLTVLLVLFFCYCFNFLTLSVE